MKIGFRDGNNRRGNHDKFLISEYLESVRNPSQPPFIVVPRSRQLHCQFAILGEGVTGSILAGCASVGGMPEHGQWEASVEVD